MTLAKRYDLELREPEQKDHDYSDAPNMVELSDNKEAAISYITGYVAKMVSKKIRCTQCVAALTTTEESMPDMFVTWKSNGGLNVPTHGLLYVCEETEKCIERMLKETGGELPRRTGLSIAMASAVLNVCVNSGVFSELHRHMFDSSAMDNHVFSLIKCCSQSYLSIRMHHLSNMRNMCMHEKVVRKQYSKLVLFNHQ